METFRYTSLENPSIPPWITILYGCMSLWFPSICLSNEKQTNKRKTERMVCQATLPYSYPMLNLRYMQKWLWYSHERMKSWEFSKASERYTVTKSCLFLTLRKKGLARRFGAYLLTELYWVSHCLFTLTKEHLRNNKHKCFHPSCIYTWHLHVN